jgi:dihydropteroate synthase
MASVAVALMNGADIVRVHDVKRARKVAMFVQAAMKG